MTGYVYREIRTIYDTFSRLNKLSDDDGHVEKIIILCQMWRNMLVVFNTFYPTVIFQYYARIESLELKDCHLSTREIPFHPLLQITLIIY